MRSNWWLIEQFDQRTGNSTGLYVAGVLGNSVKNYLDTTGWADHAKKFRWRWSARLWNWMYNQQYWMMKEWRVTEHVWFPDTNYPVGWVYDRG